MADHDVRLRVRVRDTSDKPLPHAKVHLSRPNEATPSGDVTYDTRFGAFTTSPGGVGEYLIKVSAENFEGQERQIVVSPGLNEEIFILGPPGWRYYYRGKVKVPFALHPELVAVKLKTSAEKLPEDLASAIRTWKLAEREVPAPARADRTLLYATTSSNVKEVLEALQKLPSVSRAGAVVRLGDRSISFLTNELILRFVADLVGDVVSARLREAGVRLLRKIPYIDHAFHGVVDGPATYDVLDRMEAIAKWSDIDWVEPNVVTTVEMDVVTPTDYLWAGVWDRQLVGTPVAWGHLQASGGNAFGSPGIIIACVDQGIQSLGGVPLHPEFQGAVSDGTSKVYRLFDFNNLVPNNDAVLGDHGMGVSGVATAKADNDSILAGQDEGIAGAAPNCRVMGLIFPASESDQLDMYVWAAGFNPASPLAGFPAPISPGADVFSTSIGFGSGAPISAQAAAAFDFLVTFGRGGRGCLCFFSAGNADNDFTTFRPWAAYANNFGIAASTLADDGVTEVRAPYSGFGPTALCAPSHDEYVAGAALHNPPVNYGTWSADLVSTGNLVGHAAVQTTLAAAAAAGAVQLTVANAVNFLGGGRVLIGPPGTLGSEPASITGAPNIAAGTIPVSALMNAHPVGAVVVSGANHYRNNFGGTSSATPLTAGVAALVLSADPALTFVQARQILRDTAVKIDPTIADPIGQWLDEDGNPSLVTGKPPVYSQWFGFGRVNAGAAVRKAAKMPDKPTVSYRYSVKIVCGKCEGKILSRGHYFTAINVHNPSQRLTKIHKIISTALPGESPGHVVDAGISVLGPFESFEIDCPDIYKQGRLMPGCLAKGFVILTSRTPLIVVAVYTASGADKEVETIHTERVPALEIEEERPKRPDLVPIPAYGPGRPGAFPSVFCKSRTELGVIVRNQGEGAAPVSRLRVEFLDCNQTVERDVPALDPGEHSPVIPIPVPDNCWRGAVLKFRITANATMAFEESDTTNNIVLSSCSGQHPTTLSPHAAAAP
jgi:Subtilase family